MLAAFRRPVLSMQRVDYLSRGAFPRVFKRARVHARCVDLQVLKLGKLLLRQHTQKKTKLPRVPKRFEGQFLTAAVTGHF